MTLPERLSDAELVRKHQAGVWRYLRFLGCDEARADDLTQETFLAVLKGSFQQRGEAETAAYLRTVARSRFLMAVRKDRRAPSVEELEAAESVWARAVGDAAGDEYLDALGDCLEQLDGRAREAIDLHYRNGQSRKSMAQQLGMTEDGIKTLLRRTREVLRRCVERRLGK